jgi:hypothetical protein
MRSRGNDLFRVTMMRPARNMPEVASPSEIERGWGEQKRSSAGTCWGRGNFDDDDLEKARTNVILGRPCLWDCEGGLE